MKKPSKIATEGRSIPEWVGRSPDARPPARVLLRIFDRAKGVCHISGRKIATGEKWQAEHIKALADGGENRESNLAPALIEPHAAKSAKEARTRAKVRDVRKKHLGIKAATKPIQSPGFEPPADRDRKLKKELPPRVGGIRFVEIEETK